MRKGSSANPQATPSGLVAPANAWKAANRGQEHVVRPGRHACKQGQDRERGRRLSRSAARLAVRARACGSPRRANPPPPAQLRLADPRTRRGASNHRPAARSPPVGDDRPLCAPRTRCGEGITPSGSASTSPPIFCSALSSVARESGPRRRILLSTIPNLPWQPKPFFGAIARLRRKKPSLAVRACVSSIRAQEILLASIRLILR